MNDGGVLAAVYQILIQAALLAPKILGNNLILMIVVSILLAALLLKRLNKSNSLCWILTVANILFVVYFLSYHIYDNVFKISAIYINIRGIILLIDAVLNVLYFCMVIFEVILLFKKNKWFVGKMLVLWMSAPLLMLPLIATKETGPRLFYTSNIFIILFAAILFTQLLKDISFKATSCISIFCLVISIVLIIAHGWIYIKIGECTRERMAAIDKALNEEASVVVLPKYPYEEYLWYPDPLPNRWGYFREFYGIPENIEIIIE